ncbi:hypothetical protein BGZ54_009640, partial [Gamsiella multidivaricata]
EVALQEAEHPTLHFQPTPVQMDVSTCWRVFEGQEVLAHCARLVLTKVQLRHRLREAFPLRRRLWPRMMVMAAIWRRLWLQHCRCESRALRAATTRTRATTRTGMT